MLQNATSAYTHALIYTHTRIYKAYVESEAGEISLSSLVLQVLEG